MFEEETFIYNSSEITEDFPEWFKELSNHFGEMITDCMGRTYKLIGLSYTDMDYYYLLEDSKGAKHSESCVGKITFLNNKDE